MIRGLRWFGRSARLMSTLPEYPSLLDQLLHINRNRKINLGIENTAALQKVVEPLYTDRDYRVIHVTGTNGKGSVSTKVANSLSALGFRVGLFTSPHISSFRERIRVSQELISEAQVCELLPGLLDAARQHDIPATFFELTTLLALGHFRREQVDFAVIEVGLGGRLDSTNVVHPILCAITGTSLDHTHLLGDTVELIAYEKAGIIKPGVPAVVGHSVPLHIVSPFCSGGLVVVDKDLDHPDDYDAFNQKVSRTILTELLRGGYLDASPALAQPPSSPCPAHASTTSPPSPTFSPEFILQHCAVALRSRPPCRFQLFYSAFPEARVVEVAAEEGRQFLSDTPVSVSHTAAQREGGEGVTIVLDVAHNVDGLQYLVAMLRNRFPNRTFSVVVGMSADKQIRPALELLAELADTIHPVQSDNPRACSAAQISLTFHEAELSTRFNCEIEESNGDVECGMQDALALAHERQHVVVVCGTFFIMTDVRKALGVDQPLDPADLNERVDVTPSHLHPRNIAQKVQTSLT